LRALWRLSPRQGKGGFTAGAAPTQAHAAIDDESIELQDEAEEAADKPPAAAEADGGAQLPPPPAPKPTSALAKSIAEGW